MERLLQIIRTLVDISLDVIFLPSDDRVLVRSIIPKNIQEYMCVRNIDTVTTLMRYENVRTRALIHEAKFHGNIHAWEILGMILACELQKTIPPQKTVLIPIPLSIRRLRTRGYNQSQEIVRRACVTLPHCTLDANVLTRIRDTRPQTELMRTERLTNITNAFAVTSPERIYGKHVVLIDDVMTTGATLRAARATLASYRPASLRCIALAH